MRWAIARYREDTGATQIQLAQAAKVSQSVISNLEHYDRKNVTDPYRRLCDFMRNEGYLDVPQAAYDALDQVWDKSRDHERALERLILASKDLWPDLGRASDDDQ